MGKRKLNIRQTKFAHEYLVDFNGKDAALRAGYAESCAKVHGCRLLQHEGVMALIQKEVKEREKRVKVDADYVLAGAKRMFEKCMQDIPVLDKDGNKTGEYQFDSAGAGKALKLMGDHVAVGAYGGTALTPVDPEMPPSGSVWTVEVVHMTKDQYDNREGNGKPPIEHQP